MMQAIASLTSATHGNNIIGHWGYYADGRVSDLLPLSHKRCSPGECRFYLYCIRYHPYPFHRSNQLYNSHQRRHTTRSQKQKGAVLHAAGTSIRPMHTIIGSILPTSPPSRKDKDTPLITPTINLQTSMTRQEKLPLSQKQLVYPVWNAPHTTPIPTAPMILFF